MRELIKNKKYFSTLKSAAKQVYTARYTANY